FRNTRLLFPRSPTTLALLGARAVQEFATSRARRSLVRVAVLAHSVECSERIPTPRRGVQPAFGVARSRGPSTSPRGHRARRPATLERFPPLGRRPAMSLRACTCSASRARLSKRFESGHHTSGRPNARRAVSRQRHHGLERT